MNLLVREVAEKITSSLLKLAYVEQITISIDYRLPEGIRIIPDTRRLKPPHTRRFYVDFTDSSDVYSMDKLKALTQIADDNDVTVYFFPETSKTFRFEGGMSTT